MTKIPVGNAVDIIQTRTAAKGAYESLSTAKSGSFQDVMDLYGKAGSGEAMKQQPAKPTVQTGRKLADQNAGKNRVADTKSRNLSGTDAPSDDEMAQQVKQTADAIVSEIASELDVTPEEVVEALMTLGMNVMDLGNANQMAAFVTELLKLPDTTSLLTDAELFSSVTSLTQSVDDMLSALAEELQVLPMELQDFVKEQFPDALLPAEEEAAFKENATDQQQEPVQGEEMAQLVEKPVMKAQDVSETLSKTEPDARAKSSDRADGVQTAADTGVQTKPQQEVSKEHTHDGRDSAEHHSQMYQDAFKSGLEQVAEPQEVPAQATDRATMDDIFRQIGDYVRTNVTPDVKEMEIQLTPANLGQVHISIASRNGIVTAQITAETELVKQALETQAVMLKERLESQGVRIEAVEVTVASHEFERNLDENDQNRQTGEDAQRQAGKASTRRWNLTDQESGFEEDGELSDAEQVELDMMRLGGGNLNYMV